METIIKFAKSKLTNEHLFMISVLIVNAGNYAYNLILGRLLGPEAFADAAILITMLLVLSFIAMTFQLVIAKFTAQLEEEEVQSLISRSINISLSIGIIIGMAMIIGANYLQNLFNTSTSFMFVLFGIGVPFYFLLSVNRGVYQGKRQFLPLSVTYQGEMISRFVVTLLLIYLLNIESSIIISLGILISFFVGLFPIKKGLFYITKNKVDSELQRKIKTFFLITAFYELTQIAINNSDILLVKHYFESYEAGLYASLALIGRVVFFVAWMFVIILLPEVVERKKLGLNTTKLLFKYVGYISVLATGIIAFCALFPTFAINILFGEAYISMAPLLWKYALATSLFAVSNIFAYYFLSLDKYLPVMVSAVFGFSQIILIMNFHETLETVVHMQILAMSALLIIQIILFKYNNRKSFI